MKIFNNIQLLVEQRTKSYIVGLAEDREQASLNHKASCGRILMENKKEIQAYEAWKKEKEKDKS